MSPADIAFIKIHAYKINSYVPFNSCLELSQTTLNTISLVTRKKGSPLI